MALDREAIWGELFGLLQTKCVSFKTLSRARKPQWGIEEHPVLMLLDDSGDEECVSDPRAPSPVWRLSGELVILARSDDATTPTKALNQLVQQACAALERQTADAVYLTGHVQHYTNLAGRIQVLSIRKIEKGAGEIAGQAVARLTLEIEAA